MSETQSACLSGTSTWTEKEIRQQPESWIRSLKNIDALRSNINAFLEPLLQNTSLKIILTGAGTSAFIGDIITPWLSRHTGKNFVAVPTTDLVTNPIDYLSEQEPTLLVSFARSGNSPESVATVELADQLLPESYHLMLVCNPDSQLAHYAHQRENVCSLVMPQGSNDQSFAMTSSFSCMMLSAALLLGPHSLTEAQRPLETMVARCRELRETLQPQVKAFAASGFRRYITLGGSCFTGLAEEASLKMLELTAGQIVTRYDSPLGLRHGPKFMVDNQTLVLLMLSSGDYARQYDRDLWNELQRDGLAMQMVGLTGSTQALCEQMLNLHHAEDDVWLLFPYLLFTQMLAFESSLALGLTPDNPCPTGEVNRVVKGVTIYRYPSSVA